MSPSLFTLLRMLEHTMMPDKKARLLQAQRVLHSLEIQIEQYRLHLERLAEQPHEAEKARAMLERIAKKLEWQCTYCGLLASAEQAETDSARGRSLRVA